MQLPTIHLNGTPKRMLLERLKEASVTLETALRALKETAPNGRDYPGSPEPGGTRTLGLMIATDEHNVRMQRLQAVKEDVDKLTLAIDALERT